MSQPLKLAEGQIWQVPKTLDVRVIYDFVPYQSWHNKTMDNMGYSDIGGEDFSIRESVFRSWITKKKAKLIGHYDFDKREAKAI